jgi:CspA family cold shock protein
MANRGQVKWFDPKKGYGFIIGPDGQDVFVHYSHIEENGFRLLKDGEHVDYELVQSEKGWQARSVQRFEVNTDSEAVHDSLESRSHAGREHG